LRSSQTKDPRRCSDGFINQHALSFPRAANPIAPADAWDWRRLQQIALREASRYLDADSARDAAQEATLRAWRRAATCSGEPEPWIRTIARREALRIATRRREESQPEDGDIRAQTDEAQAATERLAVADALATLAPEQQQTVFLRYWADRTEAEIAAGLSQPVGTIKVRLHRARAKLATQLAAPEVRRPDDDDY
jgi:RNA polymerase sigma-70 factor, ECF subfamily